MGLAETVGRKSVEKVASLVKSNDDAEVSHAQACGVIKKASRHWSGLMCNTVAPRICVHIFEACRFGAEWGAGKEEVAAFSAATHTRSEWKNEFHSETENNNARDWC